MKTYLAFKIPEEQRELDCAQQGLALSIALFDLDQWLRSMSKYQDKDVVSVEEVRSKIRELIIENNITCVE